MPNFEVTLNRKTTLSARECARKKVAYVVAADEKQARTIAEMRPENMAFKSTSVRKVLAW